jgi:hypothetical protein
MIFFILRLVSEDSFRLALGDVAALVAVRRPPPAGSGRARQSGGLPWGLAWAFGEGSAQPPSLAAVDKREARLRFSLSTSIRLA